MVFMMKGLAQFDFVLQDPYLKLFPSNAKMILPPASHHFAIHYTYFI